MKHPPSRGQARHSWLAHLRAAVRRRAGAAGGRTPARAYHVRDEPHERRPPGHRGAGPRHRRGGLPRGRQVRQRARAVRRPHRRAHRGARHARRHEGEHRGLARTALRDGPHRRHQGGAGAAWATPGSPAGPDGRPAGRREGRRRHLDTDQGPARRAEEAHPPRRSVHAARKACSTEMANASPTTLCRCMAARATCATSPWSATRATRASPTSTKAPRSCRWWRPSAACSAGTMADRLDEYDGDDLGATPELLARVRRARARWPRPSSACASSTTSASATSTHGGWRRWPSTWSAATC